MVHTILYKKNYLKMFIFLSLILSYESVITTDIIDKDLILKIFNYYYINIDYYF